MVRGRRLELLLEALGGLIALPLTLAAVSLIEALLAALIYLLSLLGWISARRRPPGVPSRARLWLRRLQWLSLGLLALTVVAVWVLGSWQLDATLRWVAGRIEARHGIVVEWREARGTLFGQLDLTDLSLRRNDESRSSTFDLRIGRCRISLDLLSSLQREARVPHVDAAGVRGSYVRVRKPDRFRARRPYRIEQLHVTDARVEVTDRTPRHGSVTVDVVIEELTTAPWRSERAVFDVILRTNGHGLVAARPVTATHRGGDPLQLSSWHANALPVGLAAAYLGGPLAWLKHGAADVAITERWPLDESSAIEMHCELQLRELQAELPADVGPVEKLWAAQVVAWVNRKGELPVAFDLKLDPRQYVGATSLLNDELIAQVAVGLAASVAKAVGATADQIEDAAKDRLRKLFRK